MTDEKRIEMSIGKENMDEESENQRYIPSAARRR